MLAPALWCEGKAKPKPAETHALDLYIQQADARGSSTQNYSAGSLYSVAGPLGNLARDQKAALVDDIVTIQVSDSASAVSKGVTNSSRKSSAKYGIDAAYGPTKAAGPLSSLAGATGTSQLQGQGETSRENTLTTTLTARVTHVLPNGYLVLDAVKSVRVNSEDQVVHVRGVIRPADLSPLNVVQSNRLANLEVRIDGKGVIDDAIKRPFILYRILMGLLPF
jgi:flagellar L-ring protein precursor FlgH